MRCYRVDEDVHAGIPLTLDEMGGLSVEVGDQMMPLNDNFSGLLLTAKQEVVDRLTGCLHTGEYRGRRLSDEEVSQLHGMTDFVSSESVQMMSADLQYVEAADCFMIDAEKSHHRDALVLIETAAGPNGHISFLSTAFDECVNAKGVQRRYRHVFPPAGVTVVKEGKSPQGSSCYLLRMIPGSSIRIERSGALDGEPGILTIVWKGRQGSDGACPLQMFSPERRRK